MLKPILYFFLRVFVRFFVVTMAFSTLMYVINTGIDVQSSSVFGLIFSMTISLLFSIAQVLRVSYIARRNKMPIEAPIFSLRQKKEWISHKETGKLLYDLEHHMNRSRWTLLHSDEKEIKFLFLDKHRDAEVNIAMIPQPNGTTLVKAESQPVPKYLMADWGNNLKNILQVEQLVTV
jgi:hypothetical protein